MTETIKYDLSYNEYLKHKYVNNLLEYNFNTYHKKPTFIEQIIYDYKNYKLSKQINYMLDNNINMISGDDIASPELFKFCELRDKLKKRNITFIYSGDNTIAKINKFIENIIEKYDNNHDINLNIDKI